MSRISIDGVVYNCSEKNKVAVVVGREDDHLPCNLIIPPEITCKGERFTVTGIDQDVFDRCSALIHVILPDAATCMKNAFYGCENLRGVILSKNLETLYSGTFGRCESLEHVYIPESVKVIEREAFSYCEKLQHVHLPNGLKEIWEEAFLQCTSLKEIDIPESVEVVGERRI